MAVIKIKPGALTEVHILGSGMMYLGQEHPHWSLEIIDGKVWFHVNTVVLGRHHYLATEFRNVEDEARAIALIEEAERQAAK